jgi:outer membrane protein
MTKQGYTNLLFAFGLLLFNTTNIWAQQKYQFSVIQAADYGTKNAVAVKNALIDVQLQKQTNKSITANAYPQLSAGGTFNDFLVIPTSLLPAQIFGGPAGEFIPVQFGTKYNATGNVDVAQILFNGEVFVGLQARSAAMALANKTVEITAEVIKANIYKIYYQLVVSKKQLESIDANIERFQKLSKDTREIYKQGFVEKLDVDKIEVQLNNIKTEKIKIENLIETGNAGLKFLMNMPQKDILVLTDTLSDAMLKDNILDSVYDYKNRKEIQALELASDLNKYNIKRYKLGRIPTLVAFGSYQKNAQRTKFDFFAPQPWFTTAVVGLKLSAPLFDGGARNANISKARLELQKITNTLEQTKANVDFDVNAARIKMKSALLTVDNQKINIALAEKVYNSTKKKYEAGLGSNQEIYNAQAELKVAQNNYYSALYDAVIAKVDYLKAVGTL